MTRYERRALRAHAEHYYGERHLPDWVKVIAGLLVLMPTLYFLLVVVLSF
jgi:hypothetical protein